IGLAPYADSTERARIGADLLQVPLIESVLAPCWSCGGMVAKHPDQVDADSCWPPQHASENACCCVKEVKRSNSGIALSAHSAR
ncbi:MAG TPA: hypothetical protein PKE35_17765, partial [Anaerolineales bacterium]|nr:hypothetical protein [Anaerolineales bacterium]HNC90981.1 hypothetical protein [Anaerolineales bacterium]HND93898.1 hypothetical protein [Anaerolineales bacterium]